MTQQLSVVVRTKDSAQTLPDCLRSLSEQTQSIDQIVVVDSGSTDSTIDFAKEYGCEIVVYPSDVPFNYSKSLNLGIEQTHGEFVFILSSHCVVQNTRSLEWLLTCLAGSEHTPGVSLNKSLTGKEPTVSSFDELVIDSVDENNFRGFALSNAACLIRRSAWVERQYDEAIVTAEDIDWSLHFIRKQGRSVLRVENEFVHYRNPVYSPKKDILELLYVAKRHYPQGRSMRRLMHELKSGARLFFRDRQKAKSHFLYAYYLMLDRTVGIKKHTIPR